MIENPDLHEATDRGTYDVLRHINSLLECHATARERAGVSALILRHVQRELADVLHELGAAPLPAVTPPRDDALADKSDHPAEL